MSTDNLHYQKQQKYHENEILEHAAEILVNRYVRGDALCNPNATKEYVRLKLASSEHKILALLLLDSQHRVIEFKPLFKGTIDSAKVVKTVLESNAAAVILAHNHPSRDPSPSQADKRITRKLVDTLALVDDQSSCSHCGWRKQCLFCRYG